MPETPAPRPRSHELSLGKILGCCAVAGLSALLLAVATAAWHQQQASLTQSPQALAADAPR